MDFGQITYGVLFGILDITVLLFAVFSSRAKPFHIRFCLAFFCIVDFIFSVLHPNVA